MENQTPSAPKNVQPEPPLQTNTRPETRQCQFCGQIVASNYYYCPYCGKKLIQPPITTLAEIGIYLFSLLLPPLGLWPAIRYLSQKNPRAKRVGTIALALTVIASVITIWISIVSFNSIIKTINTQLNTTPDLQNLGY